MSGLAGILAGATLGVPPAPPPAAQTYDQVVAGHSTAAVALIAWLKLADNTDTQALLANGTVTGAVFTGAKTPDTSAGSSASFDGVERVSATNSEITAAGRVGVRILNRATNDELDSIEARPL